MALLYFTKTFFCSKACFRFEDHYLGELAWKKKMNRSNHQFFVVASLPFAAARSESKYVFIRFLHLF